MAFGADRIVPLDALQFVANIAGAFWSIEGGVLYLKDLGPVFPPGKKRLSRLVSLDFKDECLTDVAFYLVQIADLSCVVDNELVQNASLITVQVADVPLLTALQVLARQARCAVIFGERGGDVCITWRLPKDRAKGPPRLQQ